MNTNYTNRFQRAIKILKSHNEWRRGAEDKEMSNPTELGEAIDIILSHYPANSVREEDIRKEKVYENALNQILNMKMLPGETDSKYAFNRCYHLAKDALTVGESLSSIQYKEEETVICTCSDLPEFESCNLGCDRKKQIRELLSSIPEEKDNTVTEGKEERKFVYFIEDTHPAYKGLWFGFEQYPVTSWTDDFKAWTNDPLKAHPFATYDEAEKVRLGLKMDGYIVTEHEFVNGLYIDKSQNAQPEETNIDHEKEEDYPKPLVEFIASKYGIVITEEEADKVLLMLAKNENICTEETKVDYEKKAVKYDLWVEGFDRFSKEFMPGYQTSPQDMCAYFARFMNKNYTLSRQMSGKEGLKELIQFIEEKQKGTIGLEENALLVQVKEKAKELLNTGTK